MTDTENQQHNGASLAGLFPLTVQVLCHMLPLKTEAAAAELARCRRHSTTARPEYQAGPRRPAMHQFECGTVERTSHAGGARQQWASAMIILEV